MPRPHRCRVIATSSARHRLATVRAEPHQSGRRFSEAGLASKDVCRQGGTYLRLEAPSQEADALQAQYFHRVLAVERDVVKTDLAIHTNRLTEAQLGDDQFQMRYQRRVIRSLETEQRKVTAMLCAIENRFHVAKD